MKSCVIGSTEGVRIAPITVDAKVTYLQTENISLLEKIFKAPRTTCITGSWNVKPVLKRCTKINSK